jgi:hypothetical protein
MERKQKNGEKRQQLVLPALLSFDPFVSPIRVIREIRG